jgi:putative transposase
VFIKEYRTQFRVSTMCRVLKASKGGFYAWLKRLPSKRNQRDQELRLKIVAIHKTSRKSYGSPRVHAKLRDEYEERCSRKRVARLMREARIAGKRRKRFVPRTTDSNHTKPIAENILERTFDPAVIGTPNLVWGGDITYIWTAEGWLYLAIVLDLFSRRAVGWAMSHSVQSRFVLDALQMAISRRGAPTGLLWHSDRGVQYADVKTRELAKKHGIECSMSRKGNCWDNAVVESFWASLKAELFDDYVPATREEARKMIFEWIEIWYNRQRLHSTLGYLTPEQFELKAVA